MLTFSELKKLAQDTANESQPDCNGIVAEALTRFMVKVYKADSAMTLEEAKDHLDKARLFYQSKKKEARKSYE